MKVSDMIYELQKAMDYYGDLPIATWNGYIEFTQIIASNDGVLNDQQPNELVLEIIT